LLSGGHRLAEAGERHGLEEVAGHVKVVRLDLVALRVRGGEDDPRRERELGVGAERAQELDPVRR
jgi:hypothetical protein